MALSPRDRYPGQVRTNRAGYPYGAARNKRTPGDVSATPLEQEWLNDLWGFEQALLTASGLTPNGNPDTIANSQYVAAIQILIANAIKASQPTRVSIPLVMTNNLNDAWDYVDPAVGSARFNVLEQTAVGGFDNIKIAFSLPYVGMRIAADGLSVFLDGASGHSALPGVMPGISLGVVTSNATAVVHPGVSMVNYYQDESSNVSNYQVAHLLKPTMAARNINPADQYWLEILGEQGANALPGLRCIGAYLTLEPQP